MVVEQLGDWAAVFREVGRMSAGGFVDGFLLEYELPHTGFDQCDPFWVNSQTDLDSFADILPHCFPRLRFFEFIGEAVPYEIGGETKRVVRVRASTREAT